LARLDRRYRFVGLFIARVLSTAVLICASASENSSSGAGRDAIKSATSASISSLALTGENHGLCYRASEPSGIAVSTVTPVIPV